MSKVKVKKASSWVPQANPQHTVLRTCDKLNLPGNIMADLSTSGGFAKKLRENTSKWDASGECIAPLTQNQRDTVLELTSMTSKRSMPAQVSKTSPSNSVGTSNCFGKVIV